MYIRDDSPFCVWEWLDYCDKIKSLDKKSDGFYDWKSPNKIVVLILEDQTWHHGLDEWKMILSD